MHNENIWRNDQWMLAQLHAGFAKHHTVTPTESMCHEYSQTLPSFMSSSISLALAHIWPNRSKQSVYNKHFCYISTHIHDEDEAHEHRLKDLKSQAFKSTSFIYKQESCIPDLASLHLCAGFFVVLLLLLLCSWKGTVARRGCRPPRDDIPSARAHNDEEDEEEEEESRVFMSVCSLKLQITSFFYHWSCFIYRFLKCFVYKCDGYLSR